MKKLITLVMIVFAANMAMAQKETTAPTNPTPLEAAKVKSHSNTNNNREAGGGAKVGTAIPATGEAGTKKKFDLGKLFKKK